jgi:hypothetical protein
MIIKKHSQPMLKGRNRSGMDTPWSRTLKYLKNSKISRGITLSLADKPPGGKSMLLSHSKQQGQVSNAK